MSDENIIYVLIAYIFCGFALIYLFLQSLKFLRDSKKKINKIYKIIRELKDWSMKSLQKDS